MRLYPEQLNAHLKSGMQPVYLLTGDEPLLKQEALQTFRQHATQHQYERTTHYVTPQFDWATWHQSLYTPSLFSDKQVQELHLSHSKLSQQASEWLCQYVNAPCARQTLLIVAPKLDKAAQQAKWVKAVHAAGVTVSVWPVPAHQLPKWLAQRSRQMQLKLTPDALQCLAEYCEGNLLAAAQSLEKLTLLTHGEPIDAKQVSSLLSDQGHYDVFALTDSIFTHKSARAIKILNALRAESIDPTLIIWAIGRELRVLIELHEARRSKEDLGSVFRKHGVWEQRKKMLQDALSKSTYEALLRTLQQLSRIDQTNKGLLSGNAWQMLTSLLLGK